MERIFDDLREYMANFFFDNDETIRDQLSKIFYCTRSHFIVGRRILMAPFTAISAHLYRFLANDSDEVST